jgi:hypothetical protein
MVKKLIQAPNAKQLLQLSKSVGHKMHSQRLDRSGILAAEKTEDHDVMIMRKSTCNLDSYSSS